MTLVPQILMFAALFAWVVFVAWYWIRARWWESRTGQNVMGVALGIAALLLMIAAQRLWPDYEIRPLVQTFVYGGLAALAIQRTWQMEHEQRRHHND